MALRWYAKYLDRFNDWNPLANAEIWSIFFVRSSPIVNFGNAHRCLLRLRAAPRPRSGPSPHLYTNGVRRDRYREMACYLCLHVSVSMPLSPSLSAPMSPSPCLPRLHVSPSPCLPRSHISVFMSPASSCVSVSVSPGFPCIRFHVSRVSMSPASSCVSVYVSPAFPCIRLHVSSFRVSPRFHVSASSCLPRLHVFLRLRVSRVSMSPASPCVSVSMSLCQKCLHACVCPCSLPSACARAVYSLRPPCVPFRVLISHNPFFKRLRNIPSPFFFFFGKASAGKNGQQENHALCLCVIIQRNARVIYSYI